MMHLVYQTNNGKIFQNDSTNRFVVEYKGNEYTLSMCGFIALKLKLDAICVSTMLLSNQVSDSLEVMVLCGTDRVVVLDCEEIIEWKDMILGGLVMLELNSIVHQRLVNILV